MRRAFLALSLLVLLPLASAQEEDPDLNESDFNDSVPPGDDAYLNDSQNASANETTSDEADPTLTESEMDTSVPTPDDSYLLDDGGFEDDAATGSATTQPTSAATPTGDAAARTPGVGVLALVAGAALVALVRRRV